MPPQETTPDSTTPMTNGKVDEDGRESPSSTTADPIVKKRKKPAVVKEVTLPKTTSRGEIVRKATEDRLTQERMVKEKELEAAKAKSALAAERRKAKVAEKVSDEAEDDSKKKKKKKTVPKKSVPFWTSSSLYERRYSSVKPKALDLVLEAIRSLSDDKKAVSTVSIKKYVSGKCKESSGMLFKNGMKRALAKGLIKQVKGKGLGGSYKLALPKKSKNNSIPDKIPIDDIMPHVFTWVCEPKEASANMIKKYIERYIPKLAVDSKAFKKALENGVAKGQLERITGKGASGTFGLVDGAKKTGTRYENAFENAIIAMNEPKDASVAALRHYLSEYNTEYGVSERPHILKNCLERLEAKGHLTRISGKGFGGTFRLAYPYHPSPRDLWKEDYESEDEEPQKKAKKAVADVSEEEDSSEEEEVLPLKKRKHELPVPRKSVVAIAKKSKGVGKSPKKPSLSKKGANARKTPSESQSKAKKTPVVSANKKSKSSPAKKAGSQKRTSSRRQ